MTLQNTIYYRILSTKDDLMPDNTSDPVAAFDQIGTMLENSATMFGTYYTALIKNGVPSDVAGKMVNDIQQLFFANFGLASPRKSV